MASVSVGNSFQLIEIPPRNRMVIRRDQRRRRVIMDESVRNQHTQAVACGAEVAEAPPRPDANTVSEPSLPRPKTRTQLRTTDLIPKRPLAYAIFLVVAGVILVGVNALSAYSPQLVKWIGPEGVAAFSLAGGPQSIANWLIGFLFTVSSLVCLQVYSLRRHRADDYRGTYRVWIWAGLFFLIASLATVVPLGKIFEHVLLTFTKPEYVRNVLLVFVFQLGMLSLLFVRGMFEVRQSWGTTTLLCCSWAAFVAQACLNLPRIADRIGENLDVAQGNLALISATGVFVTLVTYARFVYLESSGLIQTRSKMAIPMMAQTQAAESSKNEDVVEPKRTKQSKSSKKARPAKSRKVAKTSVPPSTESLPSNVKETSAPTKKSGKRSKQAVPPVPQVTSEQEAKLKQLVADQKKSETAALKLQSGEAPEVDETAGSHTKLTKSERRRLRKQKKQQRQQTRRAA